MPKVLVVDNEEVFLDSLVFFLSQEGYEVKTASSGQAAIEVGTHLAPDLLIVDWLLSAPIDGIEVAEALRQSNPDLQLIVITGCACEEVQPRMESFPKARCLEKPFHPEQLLTAAREVLSSE